MKNKLTQINRKIKMFFDSKRIKKYGIKLSIYDFLIFLMHRNDTALEHHLIRKKDQIVQRYLYNNYKEFIEGLHYGQN